jgi:hypothetical protein
MPLAQWSRRRYDAGPMEETATARASGVRQMLFKVNPKVLRDG